MLYNASNPLHKSYFVIIILLLSLLFLGYYSYNLYESKKKLQEEYNTLQTSFTNLQKYVETSDKLAKQYINTKETISQKSRESQQQLQQLKSDPRYTDLMSTPIPPELGKLLDD